jgi:hypothetical protein
MYVDPSAQVTQWQLSGYQSFGGYVASIFRVKLCTVSNRLIYTGTLLETMLLRSMGGEDETKPGPANRNNE